MEEIRCPKCWRKAKLQECVCREKDRKRLMLGFPCYHYYLLVYNVPRSTDDNTIIKDFKSISKAHFEKGYYHSGDRYL